MERTVAQIQFQAVPLPRLTRVAAYARVSSGKDAMLHSLSAQVSYYSDMIQKHPGWQYAGVYADEAITGTKDAREGFQRLLAACRAGEVDMVITKSISRLARNTVTLLETVRELKGLGVDVFFEEQNMPNVTVIPATRPIHAKSTLASTAKRRVAGYARVSTDSDEQYTSYEAQVDYYTQYIQAHADWQFVGVYADEGISGLNTKNRDGFNRMVADALDGKIDLIVTKSVSRFARNTVDSLTIIRKLKDAGCECFFEKENIYTFDGKGELLLTIMSSLAQEESRSISENVTWGQRRRFADGKVSLSYGHFLGYEKGPDGLPQIVPEEAEIVRDIYRMFMGGLSTNAIAKRLTDKCIPTPAGKDTWRRQTVESILRNEKYKGSALLQKRFTVDFLQKKIKVNEGEVPQYYVEHSHPAIILPEEWEKVQLELTRRRDSDRRTVCNSPFAGKLVCGDCGEAYGSKVWHSTSKYRRTIWQCNAKFKGEHKCRTPHLYEDDLKEHFIAALSRLLADREALLEDGRLILHALADCSALDKEQAQLRQEITVVAGLVENCVRENAARAMDQSEYAARYDALAARYEKLQSRYDTLRKKRERRQIQANEISGFLFAVYALDTLPLEFDPALWTATVDHVTVQADGRLVFRFRNGTEITEEM